MMVLSRLQVFFTVNPIRRTYPHAALTRRSSMTGLQPSHLLHLLQVTYVFVIDMPGLKSGEIKVQVEDDNLLVISGECKREDDKDGKYLRMERRVGKFMRKFALPENANADAIAAACQDGVLTITVQKLPPLEPKKPKTIEVKIA